MRLIAYALFVGVLIYGVADTVTDLGLQEIDAGFDRVIASL